MLFVTIVLDGVGIGEQPDATAYGDQGSDTLGHVLALERPKLPNLERMGLGRIRPLEGIAAVSHPTASFGKMTERSAGKDSTIGHWELAGLFLSHPFPTYPGGFPAEVIDAFCEGTPYDHVLGNRAESGTSIIDEFGREHMETGVPIVYTSADSVFQIAAHVDVISVERLYELCQFVRDDICVDAHGVGRVIARPFQGAEGSFQRLSNERKYFSRMPESPTLQEALYAKGVTTVSVGKVADLFGGEGFTRSTKTTSNSDGIEVTIREIVRAQDEDARTFIWVNLIDFDQEFGHRNNVAGFASSLEEFDRALPAIFSALPSGSRMVLTADHGNDPTTPSTDHSREYVPLLYYGSGANVDLGTRATFADHAATVADYFQVSFASEGTSFEPSSI